MVQTSKDGVIDVKAHIDPNSHLFDKIKKCVMQMML